MGRARKRSATNTKDALRSPEPRAPSENSERGFWNKPLTVTVVGALIALVGSVTIALITSSGGDTTTSTSTSDLPPVSITQVRAVATRGGQRVTFAGVARDLGQDVVYAASRPAAASDQGGPGEWFVSGPVTPNAQGDWLAIVAVNFPGNAVYWAFPGPRPSADGTPCPGICAASTSTGRGQVSAVVAIDPRRVRGATAVHRAPPPGSPPSS